MKPEGFVRLVSELIAMLSWPDACGGTHLLAHLQQGSCSAHADVSGPLPLGSQAIWQTTPARALRVAGRRREIARNWARGRRSASGRSKPFLLCLRTHIGLGAKEVFGAAPKLARTGARQGARCSDMLLRGQRRGPRKKGESKLVTQKG